MGISDRIVVVAWKRKIKKHLTQGQVNNRDESYCMEKNRKTDLSAKEEFICPLEIVKHLKD